MGDPGQHEALDGTHVPGQPGERVADAPAVEEPDRQGVQVGEHLRAQHVEEVLADPHRQVLPGEIDCSRNKGYRRVRRRHSRERSEVAGREHIVNEHLEQPDRGGVQHRRD